MNTLFTRQRLLIAAVAIALPLGAASAAETIKIGGIAPLSPPGGVQTGESLRDGNAPIGLQVHGLEESPCIPSFRSLTLVNTRPTGKHQETSTNRRPERVKTGWSCNPEGVTTYQGGDGP